jgi:hypothetical protein
MANRQSAARAQSGKPFHPFGPVLGSEPTSLSTADLKSAAYLPYPSERKTGRVFEGGPLMGGVAAMPLSLDKERLIATAHHNRTDVFLANAREQAVLEHRSNEVLRSWNKGCGRWTLQGREPSGAVRCHRLYCKTWKCPRCGPKRAKRTRYAIAAHAETRHLNKFLTLTLDPKKLEGVQATKYLKNCLHNFMTICGRQYGSKISYICVLEYQKNGNPHLHIILDRFIEQGWIQEKWHAVGGGWVFIKQVHIRKIANYLSKYLCKDVLTSPAPKGSRRVTTSRNIKLFPKIMSDLVWTLSKKRIEKVRTEFNCEAETTFDEDHLLAVFTVSPDQMEVHRAISAYYVTLCTYEGRE